MGGRGGDSPPQVSSWGGGGGGIAPPTLPTVYIMNFIAVLYVGIVPQGNHILVVLKKNVKSEHLPTPMTLQVKT